MAKRSDAPTGFAPRVFNMVKRLRFSMDDMDFYVQPEETPSSDTALLKDAAENETNTAALQENEPSLIKYQDGFPKLLFQDLQSNDSNTVLNGAMELDNLLGCSNACPDKLQTEFLNLGGHAIVLTTMQKWNSNVNIQSHLCRCIAGMILTYNRGKKRSSEGDENDLVSSLLLMGTLDQITIGALQQYPKYPTIQLDVMHALIQLCGGSSGSCQEAAKRFVRELDGVSMVTKAMGVFAETEDIQEHGCRLLNTLCITGEHQEATAIKAKALTVVAASVQAYPENESIEKDAHDLMNAVLRGEKTDETD